MASCSAVVALRAANLIGDRRLCSADGAGVSARARGRARQAMRHGHCRVADRIGSPPGGHASLSHSDGAGPAIQFHGSRRSVVARAERLSELASHWSRLSYGILRPLSPDDPSKKSKRAAILTELLTSVDRAKYEALLADGCVIKKAADPCEKGITHSKSEWVDFLFDVIKPAIPDFTWGALTSEPGWGDVDKDGWCVCSIEVTGHHTGEALRVGDLPPLSPSGTHFCFPPQQMKVKIDTAEGKVTAIEFVPKHGTGIAALYTALGGRVPSGMIDYEKSPDDANICVKGAAKLGPL